MKIKAIMYALAYGKSEKYLKRYEGARRVKQAKAMTNTRVLTTAKERKSMKSALHVIFYGSGNLPYQANLNLGIEYYEKRGLHN